MIEDQAGSQRSITNAPDIDTFRSDELTSLAAADARLIGRTGPSYEGSFAEADDARQAAKQPSVASSPPEWTKRQVGGNHYRKLSIQPLTYIRANHMLFTEGNIVKLVSRFREKGGLEDLDKLIHYAEVLREEYAQELKEQSDE